MPEFSHLDSQGKAKMVDVGHKPIVARTATASGRLVCQATTIRALREQALPKGDALTVARIAGIQAAKETARLIPLCHTLPLSVVEMEFNLNTEAILVTATVKTNATTGVEMEALTAVTVAGLTLYDMCKAVDKTMRLEAVHVVEKLKADADA